MICPRSQRTGLRQERHFPWLGSTPADSPSRHGSMRSNSNLLLLIQLRACSFFVFPGLLLGRFDRHQLQPPPDFHPHPWGVWEEPEMSGFCPGEARRAHAGAPQTLCLSEVLLLTGRNRPGFAVRAAGCALVFCPVPYWNGGVHGTRLNPVCLEEKRKGKARRGKNGIQDSCKCHQDSL